MVDDSIVTAVKRYLASLPALGIHPSRAVLFGSFARGCADKWSDIDVVVVAPEFDQECDRTLIEDMWAARSKADVRIEPIPCGEQEWLTDERRPLLTIARREGVEIPA